MERCVPCVCCGLNDDSETTLFRSVSNLLLLAMFAVTSRYSDEGALPDEESMWTAGEDFSELARDLIGG